MKKIVFFNLLMFVLFPFAFSSQKSAVQIYVIEKGNGQPVTGANLRNQHEFSYGLTNEEGIIAFPVTSSEFPYELIFTHVAFNAKTFEINSAKDTVITVEMERNGRAIQEVVLSTGLFTLPKERATGSFTFITGEELQDKSGLDIISRLEGVANGLQFIRNGESEDFELRIRGVNTIESNESPLIVLDNFVYEGDISSINPLDIQDITILKDAAAASIWGARAGNGVIVITTKKGGYKQKPTIAANLNSNIIDRPDFSYDRNWLPSKEVMGFQRELFAKGAFVEQPYAILPEYVELMIARRDGIITNDEFLQQELLLESSDIRKEALHLLYQPSINNQFNFNFQSGGEFHRSFFSLNLNRKQGSQVGNESKDIGFNFSNQFQLSNKLVFDLNGGYHTQGSKNNGMGWTDLTTRGHDVLPYTRIYNEQNEQVPILKDYRLTYLKDMKNDPMLLDWFYYPLQEKELVNKNSTLRQMRLDAGLTFRPFEGFQIRALYQILEGQNTATSHFDKDSYYVRHQVNRYTQLNGTRIIPYGDILENSSPSNLTNHSGRFQADYSGLLFSDGMLSIMGGMDIRHRQEGFAPGETIYNYNPYTLSGTKRFNYNEI